LMLDEIGDLPFALQSKLLRFLQERKIERIGGRQEIPVDVRVVCATHQDLKSLISEKRFREDLYYRIAEIAITVPPLAARKGDPVLLAHTFLRRFAAEQRRTSLAFSEEALRAIEGHPWPGNVRELMSAAKRAAIMTEGNRVGCEDLGLPEPTTSPPASDETTLDLRTVREKAERSAVISALARADGNIVKASELLGVSRPTLYDLLHRLSIKQ
jgi:two-component system, NtrC family, response regulator